MNTQELKAIISSKEETLTTISDKLGVNRSYLSRVLNGRQKPSSNLLKRLADVLELTEDQKEAVLGLTTIRYRLSRDPDDSTNVKEVKKEMEPIRNVTEANKQSEIEINIPNNMAVVYTDSAFVTGNAFGITIDFAQTLASSNKQNVVARVGLSYDHAKALINLLNEKLEKYRNFKETQKLKEN